MSDAGQRSIDSLLDDTNARFERLRHPRGGLPAEAPPAARASVEGVDYIRAFWPHLVELIAADPARLGLNVRITRDGAPETLSADDLMAAFVGDEGNPLPPAERRRQGAMLSALAVMGRVLNVATASFADDLTALPRRCPLDYLVDARRFVSLRMLLPLRGDDASSVGGNAPTLVMGGTATALTLCWNLLARMPEAYHALSGQALDTATAEAVWADTRELIFRIGGGSLAAFVALASACAPNPDAMVWAGSADLGLEHRDGHFGWTVNADLAERYAELLPAIVDAQQGQYLGCAALYARAAPLPLDPQWADPVDGRREEQVFAELVRWITAVARRHYFPTLAA
ncbi:MAG: hypothetical protein KDK06_12245 [Gammaproteobacteria bacterium]|nr:hypothetical protein [Gammaproteobacteria bacterium]